MHTQRLEIELGSMLDQICLLDLMIAIGKATDEDKEHRKYLSNEIDRMKEEILNINYKKE